jgi:Fe-Mn family superoxide dismutase
MKKIEEKVQLIESQIKETELINNQEFLLTEMRKIGIDKLPYSYSALKSFIDSETMNVHYNKHYKGYVDKLNAALSKKKFGDMDLEQIVKSISKFGKDIRNNAGGAYNHALFWKMLSPKPQKPKKFVLAKINKDFGDLPSLKKKFNQIAKENFGSGWVWLVVTDKNKLKVVTTPNQDNPLMNDAEEKGYPILGLDLWEHAYYLKYRNQKDDYIKNFWSVVNWEFVEELYKMKMDTKLNESVITRTLLEQEDDIILSIIPQYCNGGETNVISKIIFDTNLEKDQRSKKQETWRSMVSNGIQEILKRHFPERWEKPSSLHKPGVYRTQDGIKVRSLLNNLTSSYTALCVIYKFINEYLRLTDQPLLDFDRDNYEKTTGEVKRFLSIIDSLRGYIFNPSTEINKKIGNALKFSSCEGEQNEKVALQILTENYGEGSAKLESGLGLTKDMIGGIDCILNTEDGEKTVQIKPFRALKEEDSEIHVLGASSVKDHSVDLYMFVDKDNGVLQIFKNEGVKFAHRTFIFPNSSHMDSLSAKNPIEKVNCRMYLV